MSRLIFVVSFLMVCFTHAAEVDDVSNLYNTTAVSTEAISLPQSPGSVAGLSENLGTIGNTGAFKFSVPIVVPKGVNGLTPKLSLSYSSSNGDGQFGLGFSLGLPTVKRLTRNGVPDYVQDSFTGPDGDLVEIASDNSEYRTFVPRVNLSQNIYRWYTGAGNWEILLGSGGRLVLGSTDASKIVSSKGIFQWNVSARHDSYDNKIIYNYFLSQNNSILDSIEYAFHDNSPLFGIKFNYESRVDSTSSYLSSEYVGRLLRCSSIKIQSGDSHSVREYVFTYTNEDVVSKVLTIKTIGENGVDTIPPFPPVSLRYSTVKLGSSYSSRLLFNDVTFPPSLKKKRATLIDLNRDSLPDIIETSEYGAKAWINKGSGEFDTHYYMPQLITNLNSENVRLFDVDGDRNVDIVTSGLYPHYYKGGARGQDNTYSFDSSPTSIQSIPQYSLGGKNIRTIDVNGDGRLDIIARELSSFNSYLSTRSGEWSKVVSSSYNTSAFDLSSKFAFFADMTGDSLVDLVFARPTGVHYLASKGDGSFDLPKRFEFAETEPLILDFFKTFTFSTVADINGDGLGDLVAAYENGIAYSLNLGGSRFGATKLINNMHLEYFSGKGLNITTADINGNGTSDIIWSNDFGDYRYYDIADSKPGLLVEIDNGVGLNTYISYTHDYKKELPASDIINSIPFVTYATSEIDKKFWNSRSVSKQRFSYNGPYYDDENNEFRGFGQVETIDSSDEFTKASLRRVQYFLGEFEGQYPLKGLERKNSIFTYAESESEEGSLLSEVTTDYDSAILYSGILQESEFPYPSKKYYTEGDDNPITPNRTRSTTFSIEHSDGVIRERRVNVFDESVLNRAINIKYAQATDSENFYTVNRACEVSLFDSSDALVKSNHYIYDNLNLCDVSRGSLSENHAWNGQSYYVKNSYSYYPFGALASNTDGEGYTTGVIYDSMNLYPIQINEPEALSIFAVYNYSNGSIKSTDDYNGVQTSYQYDPYLRLTKTIGPTDNESLPSSSFHYEFAQDSSSPSFIKKSLRVNSGESRTIDTVDFFDPMGRTYAKVKGVGNGQFVQHETTAFNRFDKPAKVYNPFYVDSLEYTFPATSLHHSVMSFDSLGRTTVQYNPQHNDISESKKVFEYLIGEKISIDENGNTSKEYFDIFDRRIRHEDSLGNSVVYDWSLHDKISKITDPQGSVTSILYDSEGRRQCKLDPTVGVTSYLYDARDLVVQKKHYGHVAGVTDCGNPIGTSRNISNIFDGKKRLTKVDYPEISGMNDITYSFDNPSSSYGKGKVSGIVYGIGSKKFDYDIHGSKNGFIHTIDGVPYTYNYSNNVAGQLLSQTYPSSRVVSYSYEDSGMISKISSSNTDLVDTTYDEFGRLKKKIFGNGATTQLDYMSDGSSRLASINSSVISSFANFVRNPIDTLANNFRASLIDLSFEYDSNSNIVSRNNSVFGINEVFNYDSINRLEKYYVDSSLEKQWDYDSIGNILSVSGLENKGYVYSVERQQIITSFDGGQYIFDNYGNLTSTPAKTLSYDWANRLRSVESNGVTTSYSYDEESVRVKKSDDSITLHFVDPFSEATSGSYVDHVYLDNSLIASYDVNGDLTYSHTDHLGSGVAKSDASGNILNSIAYYPFGTVREKSGSYIGVPYRFTGQYEDRESELYYFGQRYYDPTLKRFITADPLFLDENELLSSSSSVSLYSYVENQPLHYVDPNGEAKVYFWHSSFNRAISGGKASSPKSWVGHVAVQPERGDYISHFPGDQKGKGNFHKSLKDDIQFYKRSPDVILDVKLPNESGARSMAATLKKNSPVWGAFNEACTNTSTDVLKAGGMDIENISLYLPSKMEDDLRSSSVASDITPTTSTDATTAHSVP